jgi:hypothetical protein
MLGGPSCPPRNLTERADTVPSREPPANDQLHVPDSSVVGTPIAKCRSSVTIDLLSLIRTCTGIRSPSRTPCTHSNVKRRRFWLPDKSCRTMLGEGAQAASTMQKIRTPQRRMLSQLPGLGGLQRRAGVLRRWVHCHADRCELEVHVFAGIHRNKRLKVDIGRFDGLLTLQKFGLARAMD